MSIQAADVPQLTPTSAALPGQTEPQQQQRQSDGGGSSTMPPPRIVIEQPDGELAFGADFERMPKPPPPLLQTSTSAGAAGEDIHTPTEAMLAAISAAGLASFALETGEQRAAAERRIAQFLQAQSATVRLRKGLFLTMLLADFLFFIGVLVYQVVREPSTHGVVGAGNSHAMRGTVPVTLWINMAAIKLEDIVFSLVLALLGFFGAIQNRVAVLSIFIFLEALCTALITLSGLSFFHLTRVLLIGLAFYLRSAVFTLVALTDAATALRGGNIGAQHRPLSWRTIAAPFVGFAGILFGTPGESAEERAARQRRERERRQQDRIRHQRLLMQAQALAELGLGPDGRPLRQQSPRQHAATRNSQGGTQSPRSGAAPAPGMRPMPAYIVRIPAHAMARTSGGGDGRGGGAGIPSHVVLQLVERPALQQARANG